MAAPAGTKLAAARNIALDLEKEWAVPVAAAGEDPPELHRNARPTPVRKKLAFMRQKKAPAVKINGDSMVQSTGRPAVPELIIGTHVWDIRGS